MPSLTRILGQRCLAGTRWEAGQQALWFPPVPLTCGSPPPAQPQESARSIGTASSSGSANGHFLQMSQRLPPQGLQCSTGDHLATGGRGHLLNSKPIATFPNPSLETNWPPESPLFSAHPSFLWEPGLSSLEGWKAEGYLSRAGARAHHQSP